MKVINEGVININEGVVYIIDALVYIIDVVVNNFHAEKYPDKAELPFLEEVTRKILRH
ncbi:MAG: hypothetical protein RR382_12235 [Tannerellaceae bacterium]